MNNRNEIRVLVNNLDKIHTTVLGCERIRKNLKINENNILKYCIDKIKDKNCTIIRKGKNYYASTNNIIITINAYSYTIITAHFNDKSKD